MEEVGKRVVVMGVGNLLRQDEGVGVHALRMLADIGYGGEADLVEGSAVLMDSLSGKETIDKLVVIDALKAGRAPGTIARVALREMADQASPVLSVNEQELMEALGLLRRLGLRVGEIVIFGVEPGETGWGMELSEPVAASLPRLAAQIERELGLASTEEQLL